MDKTDKTVLIIEDDPYFVKRLSHLFKSIGFQATVCTNGYDGLNTFLNTKFDLTLISHHTKMIDRNELISRIKSQAPNTPIITICEINSIADATDAINHGAWDYITRSLKDPLELEITVNRVMEISNLRNANFRYQDKLKDIIEKRTTALKDSELRYRYLLSTVTDYVYTVRLDNGIPKPIIHSPGCESITGFTPEEYNFDPALYNRMIYEEDRELVNKMTARAIADVEPLSFEYRIIHKNGNMRWISSTLVPYVNNEGVIDSYDGIISDITERKIVESQILLEDQRNKALLELSHMAFLPIEKIIEYALNTGVKLTNSKVGFLYLYDEDTKLLSNYAWTRTNYHGSHLPIMEKSFTVDKIGVFGEAIRERKPVILNNNKGSLFHETAKDSDSLIRHLALPVFEGEHIVALMGMGHKRTDYDDRDIRHLKLLMDGVWKIKEKQEALEALKKLNEDLENRVLERTDELNEANLKLLKLSIEDSLTGIANRRHFNEVLEDEMNRARREQLPLTLLMCDIDYFKRYNDNYGHIAGDETLHKVGEKLNEIFKRAGELPARYGGEEFIVILPNTTEEQAFIIAEKLRIEIFSLGIVHEFSDAGRYLSISIGIASRVIPEGITQSSFINMADEALYVAKNSGRNCVRIYGR